MKLHKGDQVKITSGKDRGKTGTILRAFPELDRIMIDGLNTFKKHARPKKQGEKGQMEVVPRPQNASKDAHLLGLQRTDARWVPC